MTTDPLLGVRVKIERAKEHLANLQAEVRALRERKPYRIIREQDTATGQEVYRVKILEDVPPKWGAIIGDIAHNLRSALDLLACELVVSGGGTPHRSTQFPFGSDQASFLDKGLPRIRGASQKSIRLVCRLKPYKGGNDALWRLHELNVRDKHRLLVPVGSAHSAVAFDLRLTRKTGEVIKAPVVHFRPADRQFPLKDGAELLRVPANNPHFGPDHKFSFEVAFGEGQIFDGEPLAPAIGQLIDLVERTVNVFKRHIFR